MLASAAPVLAADLGDEQSARRWPGFAEEARLLGAGAVFVFPLTIGAIRAGVMGLHRAEIDQATGTLTVQLGVPVAEAFARLRA